VEKTKTVPARGRITVNVEAEDPALTEGAVATQVTSFEPRLIVDWGRSISASRSSRA
jgi:hypothetical protein